jgi:VWFA-related protein
MNLLFKGAETGASLLGASVALLFLTIYPVSSVVAQQQKPASSQLERKLGEQSQEQADDIVRIRTDLVQTSVSVLDKRGKFVDNLRAEDFELRVDGKPYPVLFFERVVNGVAGERQTAGGPRNNAVAAPEIPTDASRTVLFFVDDLHLSSESITRTRKMLSHYVDEEMGENDEAAIASASGQIGFLQQLTSNKDVLRAAIERLKYRPQNLLDSERPRMSVYQASAIERNDQDILKYFEDVLLSDQLAALYRRNPEMARNVAERQTRSRAGRILRASDSVITQTLAGLNSAIRSSAQVPGRKLVVFVSDGFVVNNQKPDIRFRLQRITDAAVQVGAVMYTIQASGLNTSFPDASSDAIMIAGTGSGRALGEDFAAQDPLTELAADTGGKAILNANDLNRSMGRVLQESNDYYLLAWRPETDGSPGKEFHRVEVSVKTRPELSVLVQRGFFNDEKPASIIPARAEKPKKADGFPIEQLAAAIKGRLDNRPLPTYLTANYLDVPNRGPQLSILVQAEKPNTEAGNGKLGTVDVAGVIYDESGKIVSSFVDSLRPETNADGLAKHIAYLNQINVKPGLYQVRVAARDSEGLTGMATQWIKVPDLASRQLALSSLLIGEREIMNRGRETAQAQKAQLNIDRRFDHGSRLRLLTFIYNAAPGTISQSPQLNARVDIFHGNKAVVSTPTFAVETKGVEDSARIPYAGEFNLASLAKGNYRLRVTVIDLSSKTYASQETNFAIE